MWVKAEFCSSLTLRLDMMPDLAVSTCSMRKNVPPIPGRFRTVVRVQVRDKLLKDKPDALKRKALDARAFEGTASRSTSAFCGNQPGEELRPVRVDYRTGDEVCLHVLLVTVKHIRP